MWLLIGVDLFTILMVLAFEFKYDNHRSKPNFMMDVACYSLLLILNFLLLLKYKYFEGDKLAEDCCEELITTILTLIFGMICFKLTYEGLKALMLFIYQKFKGARAVSST